jgi:hypothetical protein
VAAQQALGGAGAAAGEAEHDRRLVRAGGRALEGWHAAGSTEEVVPGNRPGTTSAGFMARNAGVSRRNRHAMGLPTKALRGTASRYPSSCEVALFGSMKTGIAPILSAAAMIA